jgi:hypothetical protein
MFRRLRVGLGIFIVSDQDVDGKRRRVTQKTLYKVDE